MQFLLKKASIKFNHEPCVGVNTKVKRFGFDFRYLWVSLDLCAEWLSRIKRIFTLSGYSLSNFCRNSMNSRLRCRPRTNGITRPVCKSMPASNDTVPSRLYSGSFAIVLCSLTFGKRSSKPGTSHISALAQKTQKNPPGIKFCLLPCLSVSSFAILFAPVEKL